MQRNAEHYSKTQNSAFSVDKRIRPVTSGLGLSFGHHFCFAKPCSPLQDFSTCKRPSTEQSISNPNLAQIVLGRKSSSSSSTSSDSSDDEKKAKKRDEDNKTPDDEAKKDKARDKDNEKNKNKKKDSSSSSDSSSSDESDDSKKKGKKKEERDSSSKSTSRKRPKGRNHQLISRSQRELRWK